MTLLRRLWSHAGPRAALGWLVAYLSLCVSGQRFDTSYLNYGWQLIPWDILSNDPLRSVWYLHVQPPMWNLILGVAARVSPVSDAVTLQLVMAFFGFAGAWLAAVLARRLGLGRNWSVVVALVVTLNPEVLKGAFEPTYELAVGAMLLAVLVAIADLGHRANARRSLIVVSIAVTLTVMTRSLYHPAWALLIVGYALWRVRSRIDRRVVAVVLAIPVVVVGAWMGKNEILYSRASMSSWFGMNLQRAVIPVLPKDQLDAMYEDGSISDIAMIGPFGNYGLYEDVVAPCEPAHSFRGNSEPMRTTDQWSPNFNYECFLPVFDQAGSDAWAVIREHPDTWLRGRLWSLRTTVAVAVMPSESRSILMRSLDTAYSVARVDYSGVLSTAGWGTPIYGQLEARTDFGLLLIPLYGWVIVAGLLAAWRVLRRRENEEGDSRIFDDVLVVGAFTVLFTVLVGAAFELGEQARFRTMVDPIAWVMAAALIARVVRARRQSQAESVG
jgi:hypothetical protein